MEKATPVERVRVMLVDDHALFRKGVASLLASCPDIEVVGEAGDGAEAVTRVADLMPDLILMDIQMPKMDGLEATRRIMAEHPYLKIVMLTVSDEDRALFDAIKAGAQGYLLKRTEPDEFLAMLRGISRGEAPISRRMASKILGEFAKRMKSQQVEDPAAKLTPRERELLQLLTQGTTNKEIANTLCISENTVKNHLKNILAKLHLQNRVQAVAFALREGIVPEGDGEIIASMRRGTAPHLGTTTHRLRGRALRSREAGIGNPMNLTRGMFLATDAAVDESASETAPPHPAFTGSISRRLGAAVAAFFVLILAIGGVSSFLAWSILDSSQDIRRESIHVEVTESIHATMHHLLREVDRVIIERTLDRLPHMEFLNTLAAATIASFLDAHLREKELFPEKEAEIAGIRALEKLYHQLDRAMARTVARVAAGAPVDSEDLQTLDTVAHQLPVLTQELNEIHRSKIRRLISSDARRMKVILGAYLTFLLIGGVLVVGGIAVFSRTVSLPLRRLVSATADIAAGEFGKRVPIASQDEIGQLSQSFNDMAETLQHREAELRGAQAELSRRVTETRALYRIGVEISSMLQLNKVLHSVAEKACTLLQSQGAALCLFQPGSDSLQVGAVSGPVEASGLVAEVGRPCCLAEPSGCLSSESEQCSTCMLLEGRTPGAALAAPLKRGEDIIGALCVGRKEPSAFQPEDRELLRGLAAQAAIAIENARLYEEVRSLATIQERERIAREMHDGLAQAVGYLHLRFRTLEDRLEAGGHPPGLAELAEMRMVAKKAYADIRQSIFGLRTAVSKGLGLIPILSEYLHEFSQQSGIPVELQIEDEGATRFAAEAEIQLIRVIQEALTNVWRHAGARHAWVRFASDGDMGSVTIADDGAGLPAEISTDHGRRRFGLQTMRERVEGTGGSLEIRSSRGQGTEVVARMPLTGLGALL